MTTTTFRPTEVPTEVPSTTVALPVAHGRPVRRHIPGLDTLRAVAVLVVVGYHLGVPFLPGGFLGVTVFFVISGFLITNLLVGEVRSTGRIDLLRFWQRRARRLAPAAFTVVTVSLVWVTLFQRDLLPKLRPDAWASLFYANNWWMLARDTQYGDTFGLPSPLTHFWSLAVEEQFYVIWPLVLTGLVLWARRVHKPRLLAVAVLSMTALSAVGMVVASLAGADANRLYLGTDTRAGELLVGACLALAWQRRHTIRARWLSVAPTPVADLVSAHGARTAAGLCAGVLAALLVGMHQDGTFAFRGGLLLAALASVGLVHLLATAGGDRVTAWDAGWPGKIGRRSYSIYLWHFPVLVAFSTAIDYGRFQPVRAALVLLVTAVLSEVSYRWVEAPVRRWGFRGTARRAAATVRGWALPGRLALGAAIAAPLVVAAVGLGPWVQPEPAYQGPTTITTGAAPEAGLPGGPAPLDGSVPVSGAAQQPTVLGTTPRDPLQSAPLPTLVRPVVSDPRAPRTGPEPVTALGPVGAREAVVAEPSSTASVAMTGPDTLAVGDSLMIDIAPVLNRRYPGITINAKVGRQPSEGLTVAQRYRQFDRPGTTYLLGIGTNGAINSTSLSTFCRRHPDSVVLLVTPRVARPWERASVDAIRDADRACDNVRVADFHTLADGRNGWFTGDGVHLTDAGVKAMVGAIGKAGRAR